MKKLTLNATVLHSYNGFCELLTENTKQSFYLPLNLPQKVGDEVKLQFTIGINTKNKGFWVSYEPVGLVAYKSYKDYKDDHNFVFFCHEGLEEEFACTNKFFRRLFKQPTKVGVKVVFEEGQNW